MNDEDIDDEFEVDKSKDSIDSRSDGAILGGGSGNAGSTSDEDLAWDIEYKKRNKNDY